MPFNAPKVVQQPGNKFGPYFKFALVDDSVIYIRVDLINTIHFYGEQIFVLVDGAEHHIEVKELPDALKGVFTK